MTHHAGLYNTSVADSRRDLLRKEIDGDVDSCDDDHEH
jgi:hypothetical protein